MDIHNYHNSGRFYSVVAVYIYIMVVRFNEPWIYIIIITAVVSIASYLIDKGEPTALYKINNNVYIETSEIITIWS